MISKLSIKVIILY